MRKQSRIWISPFVVIGLLLILVNSCKKDENNEDNPIQQGPVLTTIVTAIMPTTASSGGNVTSDIGESVIARGVCWNISTNPTIANSKTTDGTGRGTFTSSLTGLTANTTYYVRAYAKTSQSTVYGSSISFKTLPGGTVTDIDGNVYNTVTIGTQVWMKENLKTTRYRNGNLIGTTNPYYKSLKNESTPKYQWAFNGSESNVATYGRLYTWYAVTDSRNVCPVGWHVPSDAEWTALTNYLGGYLIAGGKLKETGTTHWLSPNTGATNETGFTALPGGFRDDLGVFGLIEDHGWWWSSTGYSGTDAWFMLMYFDYSVVNICNNYSKKYGFSVRCLKD